jgi:hypothetical protein
LYLSSTFAGHEDCFVIVTVINGYTTKCSSWSMQCVRSLWKSKWSFVFIYFLYADILGYCVWTSCHNSHHGHEVFKDHQKNCFLPVLFNVERTWKIWPEHQEGHLRAMAGKFGNWSEIMCVREFTEKWERMKCLFMLDICTYWIKKS